MIKRRGKEDKQLIQGHKTSETPEPSLESTRSSDFKVNVLSMTLQPTFYCTIRSYNKWKHLDFICDKEAVWP